MARVAVPRRTTAVERKIYFYQIDAGQKNGAPVIFDPVPVLQRINELPFTMEGRYLDMGEGNVTFVQPHALSYPQKLVFVLRGRSNLPELERQGDLSALPIPLDSGLGDKIHVY